MLRSRYDLSVRLWKEEDRREFKRLAAEEARLDALLRNITPPEQGCLVSLWHTTRQPFSVALGSAEGVASTMLMVGVAASVFERLLDSTCGAVCSWMLKVANGCLLSCQ